MWDVFKSASDFSVKSLNFTSLDMATASYLDGILLSKLYVFGGKKRMSINLNMPNPSVLKIFWAFAFDTVDICLKVYYFF